MKKILLLYFVLTLGIAYSQNKSLIDSLTTVLKTNTKQDSLKGFTLLSLAQAYYGVNPEKMFQYADDAGQLSERIHFKKGMAEAFKLKGAAKYTTGDFKNAELYLFKGLTIFQEIKFSNGIIVCFSNLGSIKMVQNDYPQALSYYQSAIRVAKHANAPKLAAIAYGNMGIIYNEMKKYDLALQHFNDALETHKKANYADGVASNLSNIGNTYFHQKEYDKALLYFTKALDNNLESNNKLGVAREYGNIANVYSKQHKYEEAFGNYKKALVINEELKNKKGIAVNYKGIGEYYVYSNKLDEALIFLKKSNALATELGVKDIQKETFGSLSEVFEKKGIPDSAYVYLKKHIEIKEIMDNENNRKEIARLEIQYEFDTKEEKYKIQQRLDSENLKQQTLLLALNASRLSESNKERDLASLNYVKTQLDLKQEQLVKHVQKKQLTIAKKEIEIATLYIKAKEKQKWFFIAGIISLAIILSLIFLQSRNRKKTNEKLNTLNQELDQANKVKARFFSVLNHDLRSPVANIIHFLHLQKDNADLLDAESKTRMENKTISSAENLLSSMEDLLFWSKGQMERFKPKQESIHVNDLFEEIKNHFLSEEKVMIVFENREQLTIVSDIDYLKTIMRNLTANAIKAIATTPGAAIVWKAWKEDAGYCLAIHDNGNGAEQEIFRALYDEKEITSIKTGLGLHLIKDFAKAINCEISVTTKINEGTTVVLKIQQS